MRAIEAPSSGISIRNIAVMRQPLKQIRFHIAPIFFVVAIISGCSYQSSRAIDAT
jgi:hypothetical protein